MEIPNQEKIWNIIAREWKTFRVTSVKEATEFIGDCKGLVLDLGCGSGRNFTKIPGKLYACDFSKEQLKYAQDYAKKEGIHVIIKKSNADKLPFKENFFDKIIFIATLHCIDSEYKRKKVLMELFRILKSNGEALITVWDKEQKTFKNTPKEILKSWTIGEKRLMRYYYLYDKREISALIKSVGFKIIKILDKETKDSKYSKRNILVYVKKP